MAKNYSIDYGAKGGPALMDDDTGYEVGEAPHEKTVRQLTNLKNYGKDPKNYKEIKPKDPNFTVDSLLNAAHLIEQIKNKKSKLHSTI